MIEKAILIGVLCGLLTIGGLTLAPSLLHRLGVYDIPETRSSHAAPVLRGAGIALAPAIIIALTVAAFIAIAPAEFIVIAVGGALVASIGIVEDLRGVPIQVRLAGQVAAGLGLAATLVISGDAGWLLALCAVAIVPVTVNVANFMDGVDLMSGLHGVVFGVAFVASGVILDLDWLVIAGAVLAVSFGVFLPFNVRARRRLFLGDSGSYLLGGMYSFVGVLAIAAGAPAVTVVAPVAIYLADTATTLLRRIITGKDWLISHREHHYHQLEDLGWPHRAVSAFTASLSALCAAIGLWAGADSVRVLIATVLLLTICGAYLGVPILLRRRIAGV